MFINEQLPNKMNAQFYNIIDNKEFIENKIDQFTVEKTPTPNLGDNYVSTDRFMPLFFEQYQNKFNYSTDLGAIYKEFIEYILPPIENLNELNRKGTIITTKKDDIMNKLNSVINDFQNLEKIFTQTSEKMTDNLGILVDIYINIIMKIFEILLILFILFPMLSLLSLFLFIVLKLSCGQFCLHLFWNLNILIIALIFIIGGILGILGVIGNNLVPIISYLLSPEYMGIEGNIYGGNKEIGNLINLCLNGDGNLYNSMEIESDEINIINDFLLLSRKSMAIEKNINELTPNSQKIALALHNIEKYIEDPALTTKGQNVIEYDYEYNLNLLRECDNNFNFTFRDCTHLSPYCEKNENCCKFDYSNNVSPKNFNEDCESKFQIMYTSYFDVQDKLKHFNYILNELNEKYTLLLKDLKEKYSSINNQLTGILIDIYDPIIGEKGELKNMFDCSYMKQDMINFFYTLHNKYSKSNKKLCTNCIIAGIFSYISLLFIIMILYDHVESGPKVKPKLNYKKFRLNRKNEIEEEEEEKKEEKEKIEEKEKNEEEEKKEENNEEIIKIQKKTKNSKKHVGIKMINSDEIEVKSSSRGLNEN